MKPLIRSPVAILALLTGLNFLNYMDRLVVSAVLPRIQDPRALGGLELSNFEAGLLATVFLIGYFATAPIFGQLADRGSRRGLIAFGVITWSLATAASGLADSFGTMMAARAIVGIGEASYATLAPTIIDDLTPPEKKGKALAIFYAAMPLGAAAGYMLGGFVQAHWGWRAAFYVAGGPGIVLAVSCLMILEPERKLRAATAKLGDAVRTLWRIALYRRAVLGYCAHTAAIGAFSYWAPKYLEKQYQLDLKAAGFWFGVITVAAGFIGTVLGGRWADRLALRDPITPGAAYDDVANRRGANALLRVCAIGVLFATPLSLVCLLSPSAWPFFVICFFVELGLFVVTSPINAVMLRTVPTELRASAMAIAIFAIHIFGDLWSPPLVGLLADYMPMVMAMLFLPVALGMAGLFWWPRAREAAP